MDMGFHELMLREESSNAININNRASIEESKEN